MERRFYQARRGPGPIEIAPEIARGTECGFILSEPSFQSSGHGLSERPIGPARHFGPRGENLLQLVPTILVAGGGYFFFSGAHQKGERCWHPQTNGGGGARRFFGRGGAPPPPHQQPREQKPTGT